VAVAIPGSWPGPTSPRQDGSSSVRRRCVHRRHSTWRTARVEQPVRRAQDCLGRRGQFRASGGSAEGVLGGGSGPVRRCVKCAARVCRLCERPSRDHSPARCRPATTRKEELHGNSVGSPALRGGPWRGVLATTSSDSAQARPCW
jgi:hypothetical protein